MSDEPEINEVSGSDVEILPGTIVPKKKVEVLAATDTTPLTKDMDKVVEDIVLEWNGLVNDFQNTTIKLCLMIKEMIKDFPDESVKDILKKVREHPNIKQFVSIDRIWQGMRLINKRPDLITYHNKTDEEKKAIEDKPYIKKDGEIFWEFYFELAKQHLSDQAITMLEIEGKTDKWSFRQLRDKIQDAKEELSHPTGFEARKKEKYEVIRKIMAMIRHLPLENLRGVLTLCQEFQKENLSGNKKEE